MFSRNLRRLPAAVERSEPEALHCGIPDRARSTAQRALDNAVARWSGAPSAMTASARTLGSG